MNLDDLTGELSRRADAGTPEPGSGVQVARLAGVRHRIQVRRRRRAGVAVAALALLIGGLSWQPELPWTKTDRQLPAKVSQVDRVFPAARGDDPRIAAAIGLPGQTVLELRFTPSSSNLSLAMLCAFGEQSADVGVATSTTVNGHPYGGGSCNAEELSSGTSLVFDADDAKRNSRTWQSELGVEPGQESVARITYTGGPAPAVQVGLAFYERSGARVMAGAKALEQTISLGQPERRYTLQRYASRQLRSGLTAKQRSVLLPGTASNGDIICYGTTGGSDHGSTDQLIQDNLMSGGSDSGGYSCEPVENTDSPDSPATFRMQAGKLSRGTAVIALYRAESARRQ